MNETLKLLMERKSIRAFEDRPIPKGEKDAVLAAAMRAPTAGNMMFYSILDVTDQKMKDTLAVTCDHQPFIATAPMVLIFLADYRRWYRKFRQAGCAVEEPKIDNLILCESDAVIAAHAACVAAESLGIGSCYIGDIMENWETHRDMFELPRYVAPVCMLVLGYPTAQQREHPQTSRFPRETVVFENKYHDLTEEELRAFVTDERAVRVFNFKCDSDFAREAARSTGEILKNWEGK